MLKIVYFKKLHKSWVEAVGWPPITHGLNRGISMGWRMYPEAPKRRNGSAGDADKADLRGFGFACGEVFCHKGTKAQSLLGRKSFLSVFVPSWPTFSHHAEGGIKIRVVRVISAAIASLWCWMKRF